MSLPGCPAMKTPRATVITSFLQPRPSKFAKVVSGADASGSARRASGIAPPQVVLAGLQEPIATQVEGPSPSVRQGQALFDKLTPGSGGSEQPLQDRLEQERRMELNKAAACAKRNLRVCEERLAETKARGVQLPNFGELLVEKGWYDVLSPELKKPYLNNLFEFVRQEGRGEVPVYPPPPQVFHAFNSCPFDKVKVVILGQDPYHGPGQAMGLSFSVPEGVPIPSSLLNIYKEINQDLGCSIPKHGNLEKWAYQGVLLLNAVLTVREHHANSHSKKGWEPFTDAAIRAVSQKKKGVVFLLWGKFAQEKARLIDAGVHHVLKAAHPSGLSAHKGFFSCRHFSKTNSLLQESGIPPIDWQI